MALSVFPAASAGFDPTKVSLQQTITSGTSVTIPSGINWVYAVVVGGGGGGAYSGGGNAGGGGGGGGVTVGWAKTSTSTPCTIGAGGAAGTRGGSASSPISTLSRCSSRTWSCRRSTRLARIRCSSAVESAGAAYVACGMCGSATLGKGLHGHCCMQASRADSRLSRSSLSAARRWA